MAITTVEHVAKVLHLGDAADPTLLQAWEAAESQVASECRWSAIPAPAALVESVILRTARLLARRDSPTGVIGVGEFGPVRLSTVDRDVEALEAHYRKAVFA